jgi:hypothetical protein
MRGLCKAATYGIPQLIIYSRVEALMDWAMEAAHQQHSQAIAEATAAAEAAQRTGEGPKPMMVTPYKHNWVISGTHPEHESPDEEWYASFSIRRVPFS